MGVLSLSEEWIGGVVGRRWKKWEYKRKRELGMACKIRLFFFLKKDNGDNI